MVFDLKIIDAVRAAELEFFMIDHWMDRLERRFAKKRAKVPMARR